ncbi:transcriptional regulator, TetR family [Acetobacter malorum]|uniref:Transcriptional regulator, TetR family n=1 Tax=Acetobacter malorum TaxID=178901 RepID=A0A177G546_9PROT|nr:transcriptional regulator, TetR family [Acetobacter malorum]
MAPWAASARAVSTPSPAETPVTRTRLPARETFCRTASRLAETHAPVEALRAWLNLFVDYIATKQVIAPALNSLIGGTDAIYADSRTVLTAAIGGLVTRATGSGDIRPDIEPVDLLCALGGVSNYATGPGWEVRAKRLVDVLIAGSRPEG